MTPHKPCSPIFPEIWRSSIDPPGKQCAPPTRATLLHPLNLTVTVTSDEIGMIISADVVVSYGGRLTR